MNTQDIKKVTSKEKYDLNDLRIIFSYLRGENGCPWDRVQTHESIRSNLIEETYEVIEAIDNSDSKLMKEELGDLLLQVVFHAAIKEEEGAFTLDDVITDVADKLVRRHPHVFGDDSAEDPDGAIDAWEKAKSVEKKDRKNVVDSMNAIPPSLPALMRAQKIVKKATKDGFDFSEILSCGACAFRKMADAIEMNENGNALSDDFADALFALAALAHKNGDELEELLTKKSNSFIESYN